MLKSSSNEVLWIIHIAAIFVTLLLSCGKSTQERRTCKPIKNPVIIPKANCRVDDFGIAGETFPERFERLKQEALEDAREIFKKMRE